VSALVTVHIILAPHSCHLLKD